MKTFPLLLLFAFFTFGTVDPAVAMKSHQETFPQPCDVVWKAAVTVAKTQQYRIVSVSKEEQIISVAAGGIWWGERLLSLSLQEGKEHGCTATVQSRYSGLQHSDGPDLLARVHVQLVGDEVGRESEAFTRFERCVSYSYTDENKCEKKLRKRLAEESDRTAAQQKNAQPPLWNVTKP
jgi:hypothetical protein